MHLHHPGSVSIWVHRHSCATQEPDARRYAAAKELGIFKILETPSNVTTADLIARIVDKRAAYEARNKKKVASEKKYEAAKE